MTAFSMLHPGVIGSTLLLLAASALRAQDVQITVDATQGRIPVSPYIYGRNNSLSDSPQQPTTAAQWQLLRDSGVRILRENGGNNATKYNWQKKLSSHPDWYNNVYAHDWDYAQRSLQENLPGVQGFWAFQMLGKVADNTQNNFNEWDYNRAQYWEGVGQNLAGGGTPNTTGGHAALVEGNPSRYLTDSDPATSTAILDHWVRTLNLDRRQFRYWNMDNESEIWNGTHDDVVKTAPSGEAYMQRYFEYAKAARARYPEIKLMGPVPANEWQWYNYAQPIVADGRQYPWLEYFIKRVGEEQARTGIRLLDVIDIHFYPGSTNATDVLQYHRVFFDTGYVYPEANGVKTVNGGWDNSINKEYIFVRCREWLKKYIGEDHGVTFAVSETAIGVNAAPVQAVWYASMLGEFMRNGVEVFTPWSWNPGMWEVLHLYARYNYATAISGVSSDETFVSAYPTRDDHTGNLTVVLVNRSTTAPKTTSVSLVGTGLPDGTYSTLRLSNLPSTETFVSHTNNALQAGTVTVTGGQFSVTLPQLSITSVLLKAVPDASAPTPPSSASRLANVSVRAKAGPGGEVLIVGFVVSGSGSKQVLLRGVGPTLKAIGLPTGLDDSRLRLFDSGQVMIQTNDKWSTNAVDITALANAVGAFPLDAASEDAALAPTLSGGGYTAHIDDPAGGRGIALGEVYDTQLTSPARLVNVSARTVVGTGPDNLIAGFSIDGPAEKTVLIRAVGPTLAQYGVTGVLANPVLRVYRQGVALPIYQNDNWGDIAYAAEISSTADRIQASGLPAGSKDAALLLTLPRGVYTAVVSGLNDTTGAALVEVYEVE